MRCPPPLGLLVIASLAACADASEDAGRTTPVDEIDEALSLLDEPWCGPFAVRFCAAAATCGCAAASDWPSDCVTAARAQCRRDLRVQADAVAAQGFLVSRDGAPACLALIDEAFATCNVPERSRFNAECRLITARAGEAFPRAGERCASGLCARGLRCASDLICRVPRAPGELCSTDGDCASPLVCRSDCQLDPMCRNRCVVRPTSQSGLACGIDTFSCGEGTLCHMSTRRECGPSAGRCLSDLDCPVDEVCGRMGFQQCSPLPALGEYCGDRFQCRTGLACEPRSFTCVVAPGLGETCLGLEFGFQQCAPGLTCRGSVCAARGGLGEACSFGLDSCEGDLGCEFDVSGIPVCQPIREVDDRCQTDLICGPDRFCDFTTLTCQARRAQGERCQSSQQCPSGLQCVESQPGELRCEPVLGEGDACSEHCPVGLACRPTTEQSTCVPEMCGALKL